MFSCKAPSKLHALELRFFASNSFLWAVCIAATITVLLLTKLKSPGPVRCSFLRTFVSFSFQPLSPHPLSDVWRTVFDVHAVHLRAHRHVQTRVTNDNWDCRV